MGCVGGDEGGSGGGGGGGVIAVEEALEASEAQPVWQPMIGAMPYDVRWCLPFWRCSLLGEFYFPEQYDDGQKIRYIEFVS